MRVTIALLGLLVAVVALGWWLFGNAERNMAARGLSFGFGFLERSAGIPIGEHMIPYTPADTYARALTVGLINTLDQLPQFGLYIKVGLNAGYLSFTSTVPEYVTFLGTALTAGQSPPENLLYMWANIYTAYSDLNLPDFQRVLVNSTSITVTSPIQLNVIPSSQGRYSLTHSGSAITWFQICTINAPSTKKHIHGVGGGE
jgi:hypothetical protein